MPVSTILPSMLLLLSFFHSQAQRIKVTGVIYDSLSMLPVTGATIVINTGDVEMTDETGGFSFMTMPMPRSFFSVSAIGYQKKNVFFEKPEATLVVMMQPVQTTLANVSVTGITKNPYKVLGETDIEMRRVANSQEILRMVPGLFIGQHQGGGKAEQIFLRGFDVDHGKDLKVTVDGIPVNMVSHAHSQGYADSHFIIPETIERAVFNKGPYDADKGNHTTTGHIDFATVNVLPRNTLKAELGQFNTYRILGLTKLLNEKLKIKGNSWYAASEYSYSDGFFEMPQHFKRFNFFSKLNYALSPATKLIVSASAFYSSWRASGQIPQRAVSSGLVGYFGALDPNEGGATSRYNVNLLFRSTQRNGAIVENQIYYSKYGFDLQSNFTFFLVDSINGDAIRQREKRNLFGYHGNYTRNGFIVSVPTTFQFGIDLRSDIVVNSELSHTRQRFDLLNRVKLGDIRELGLGMYSEMSVRIRKKWVVKTGLRVDRFYYIYRNKIADDTAFAGPGLYRSGNQIFSPKVNIYYNASSKAQLYFSAGKGFHTNDTRVMVTQKKNTRVPAAYGIDIGYLYKPVGQLLIHTALWYIYLQQETVYAGDGGTIDFSGRTRRMGFDLSLRYQPVNCILVDADFNFAHGRTLQDFKGNNYIPLAPVWSSTGGVKLVTQSGWSASLRYRYLSKRPANQNYSLVCAPYFVNDMACTYKKNRFEYGVVVNNLFNVRWKETQFETLTRLRQEPIGVTDITFTAGTKISAKLIISYAFGFTSQTSKLNTAKK